MSLSGERLLSALRETGAFLKGHFLLTSGRHSADYIEKFRLLERPHLVAEVCQEWKRRLEGQDITIVVGPAVGGIVLAYELARQLGCRYAFAEGESHSRELRRGFVIGPDDRAVVVDDVVTTGGSLMATVKAVRQMGASLVAAAILVYRGQQPLNWDVPLEILLHLPLETYPPDDCPLCQKGESLVIPKRSSLSR
ncbi:MAG: orotate phosphoribosyltransferase [Armatimonadetes bacterium]|nr:orotate phosphoribosyltransferase [Armatimonadota bacterium]MDW8122159.1 orotate phosphoribosyltransferase [Armatimonadota bacterium]